MILTPVLTAFAFGVVMPVPHFWIMIERRWCGRVGWCSWTLGNVDGRCWDQLRDCPLVWGIARQMPSVSSQGMCHHFVNTHCCRHIALLSSSKTIRNWRRGKIETPSLFLSSLLISGADKQSPQCIDESVMVPGNVWFSHTLSVCPCFGSLCNA